MLDGRTRKVELHEVKEGMVLRAVQSDGTVAPFSDVVVTRVEEVTSPHAAKGSPYSKYMVINLARPFAFAHLGGEMHSVENILRVSRLDNYQVVLTSRGQPYMMSLNK